MGGFRVQATSAEARSKLLEAALELEDAGAFAIVLEGVPREVAAVVTRRLLIPVVGIGAGPDCDGQILVLHDLLGLTPEKPPKFVRRYASLFEHGRTAIAAYVRDVETGRFPADAESYHAPALAPFAEAPVDEDWL
jgi:3-methyl-2-oxobutanoate hydroxymethyltransferase